MIDVSMSALPSPASLTLDIPPSARPLGRLAAATAYARSCAHSLARLLMTGRQRSDGQVASEYDQGSWEHARQSAAWKSAESLEAYVAVTAKRPIVAMMDGRLCRIPAADYYSFRACRLRQLLATYGAPDTPIVELGCGVGGNLFQLRASGVSTPMKGFDISPTGLEVARAVAAHFGQPDMSFDRLDLRRKDDPAYREIAGATVFTYYCLEQIPSATREVLDAIAAAGPTRVIHIEPSTELLSWRSLSEAATKAYVLSQDYQRTLLRTAQTMEREGRLKIEACSRMRFAPTQRNFPLVLIWEPR